ncbi:hypothetical protein Btru_015978 [Bulinus truncatus]|nr:hypothetical protein Btru_015978 [Bulinus truncatus]
MVLLQFKKEFISSTAATDSYDVLVQYNDGTAERVSDPQILDEQLQKCQSLLLLPKENVDIISQRNPVTELNSVRNPNYSWVDELPEKVMNLRIKERDAVALPASLEKILHQLMLILEFKKGELEIAVLDTIQVCFVLLIFFLFCLILYYNTHLATRVVNQVIQ